MFTSHRYRTLELNLNQKYISPVNTLGPPSPDNTTLSIPCQHSYLHVISMLLAKWCLMWCCNIQNSSRNKRMPPCNRIHCVTANCIQPINWNVYSFIIHRWSNYFHFTWNANGSLEFVVDLKQWCEWNVVKWNFSNTQTSSGIVKHTVTPINIEHTKVLTAYNRMAAVNSLPSMSFGANSTSSCPSSPPAHFPSPPEEEFTIRSSWVPCWMQAKPWPQSYLTCIACYAMTELWSAGCASQPARPPGDDAARWSGKGTPHPPTQMARPCRT